MRVVIIVAPFAPQGVGTRRKFVLSSPRGKSEQETCAGSALAAVRHGRARQTLGTCGDCRRVLWVLSPRCQFSGKIRFVVQDEGDCHVAKHNSDFRLAYPEAKLHVRDLVRVVNIVAPLGVGTRRNFVLSSPMGKIETGNLRR